MTEDIPVQGLIEFPSGSSVFLVDIELVEPAPDTFISFTKEKAPKEDK